MAIQHLNNIGRLRNILVNIGINDLASGLAVVESLLHHATAHSSHLGTMLGIDNGSNNISTEGRTNLIEQIVVVSPRLGIVKVTNLEFGTVSSQATGERR